MSAKVDQSVLEENQRKAHERYLAALCNVVSGGLVTDMSEQADLPPERALLRTCGALVKAVVLASNPDAGEQSDVESWGADSSELSPVEATDALTGIYALMLGAPTIIEHLKMNDEWRASHERIARVEAREDARIRLVGERQIAEDDAEMP